MISFFMFERVKGIEPSFQPWEGRVLPLNHTRVSEKRIQPAPATMNGKPTPKNLVPNLG